MDQKKYKKMLNAYILKQLFFGALYVCAMGVAAFYLQNIFISLAVLFLCIIMSTKIRRVVLSKYKNLLDEDCNPEDYLGFYGEFEKFTKSYYGKIICRLEIAKALYYMGDSAQALRYLAARVPEYSLLPQELMLYYNLIINCYFHRGDCDSLEVAERKISELSRSENYPVNVKAGFSAMREFAESAIAFIKKDPVGAMEGQQFFENIKFTKLQSVCNSYRMACIHLWKGEKEEAEELFNYVREYGNGLYHVKLAEEKLKEMAENID